MGCCCEPQKTIERNPPRCNPGEYPKNPHYAGVPENVLNMPHPMPPTGAAGMGGGGLISGSGREGAADAMAFGYMMGHGGTDMIGGIDGGPRVAIGGNYHGLM